MENKTERVRNYIMNEFRENPSILVGCMVGKWKWDVCGRDIIVFTNNVHGCVSRELENDVLNIYYHSIDELERRENYELRITLLNSRFINDPNLSLASLKEELSRREGEVFSEAFRDEILVLLKDLTYAEEALNFGADASAAFWTTVLGYNSIVALNLLNRVQTSPSHLIQQVKENQIFRGTNYFVSIASFLGFEYANSNSYKRIFSTLPTLRKMIELYLSEESFMAKMLLLSPKVKELSRKCIFATEQYMPLNAHVISTKWFVDSVVELYETICLTEKISPFKPKMIEELEKRRRNLYQDASSISNSILQEVNPSYLGKRIEEARELLSWLQKMKV